MKKIPQKVHIALDSINNMLQSIGNQKKKGAHDIFFIMDTLLVFEGAISRAIGKTNFESLTISIRSTMRAYAEYIDNPTSIAWATVDDLSKKAQELLSMIINIIRSNNMTIKPTV